MEKFLIMTDLDSTLLNKKSKLSKMTIRYVKKLTKMGHYFILATGRPYQGCIHFYKQLNLSTPLVCDNGGSIHFPNNHSKDIFTSIPLDIFISFLKSIKEYIYSGISSNFDTIYYQNRKEVPFFLNHLKLPRKIIEGNLDEIIKIPPINPTLFVKSENIDKVLSILNSKYSETIKYRCWKDMDDRYSLELYHKDATKGGALLKLKELLEIPIENDLVFGDQLNDIEMITNAYNGVAMINGKDELKKIAKYITDMPNYKNGEIKFIKKFFKNINKKAP